MNFKRLLICFFLVFVIVAHGDHEEHEATGNDDFENSESPDSQENLENLDLGEDYSQQQRMGGSQQEMNEEMQEKLRLRTISCIIASRTYFFDRQKEIYAHIESFSKKKGTQTKLYKKIMAQLLEKCYMSVSDIIAQQILETVKTERLNMDKYTSLFQDFDLTKYDKSNLDLTQMEEQLMKFADEFEEMMQKNREKEEGTSGDSEDSDYRRKPEDYEPKIAGLSIKDTPMSVKMLYLGGIILVIGLLIYFGIKLF